MAQTQENNIDELFDEYTKEVESIQDDLGRYVERKIKQFILLAYDKSGLPQGDLFESIQVHYNPNTNQIELGMRVYGYFLNFGVMGIRGGSAIDVDLWGVNPRQGAKYKFTRQGMNSKAIQQGIRPRVFLPNAEQIQEIVELFMEEREKI